MIYRHFRGLIDFPLFGIVKKEEQKKEDMRMNIFRFFPCGVFVGFGTKNSKIVVCVLRNSVSRYIS